MAGDGSSLRGGLRRDVARGGRDRSGPRAISAGGHGARAPLRRSRAGLRAGAEALARLQDAIARARGKLANNLYVSI